MFLQATHLNRLYRSACNSFKSGLLPLNARLNMLVDSRFDSRDSQLSTKAINQTFDPLVLILLFYLKVIHRYATLVAWVRY